MLENLKDVEALVTELRKIVINTFYTWIYVHHSLLVPSLADFFEFLFFFFFRVWVLLCTAYILGLHFFTLFNDNEIIYQKKKNSLNEFTIQITANLTL
jgi:hypothetical protein